MKTKLTLLSLLLLLSTGIASAQKKDDVNIISGNVRISKYHEREELQQMQKGQLLELYKQRIEVIIRIIPNIAFATMPGKSMKSLGIPETKDNKKALVTNHEATDQFFESTIEFQRKVLPYSDKSDLISAILFYENTLKSLHTYNDYK